MNLQETPLIKKDEKMGRDFSLRKKRAEWGTALRKKM